LRRSLAMAPLASDVIRDVLDDYHDAPEQLAVVLTRLGPGWQTARDSLNELARIISS